ncbi:MAG: hypothetical protein PF505_08740 [Vallitaleaceae bacterium]|jgi:type II secretory pathway pseudopilin PulG|nr:hypothetical protein [Vallitaleaceae bacterium]
MMNKKNNRLLHNIIGLTVVEVMVAIVIAGIISGAIGSYLMVHIKSYEVAQDVIDLQYEAQMALNGMSEIIMESRGLYEIQDQDGNSYVDGTLINDGYVADTKVLAFQGLEVGGLPLYHVFIKEAGTLADPLYEVMYYNTTNPAILLDSDRATLYARNVSNMAVIAAQGSYTAELVEGSSVVTPFDKSTGVEVVLYLEVGEEVNLEVRTIAKYRNIIPN